MSVSSPSSPGTPAASARPTTLHPGSLTDVAGLRVGHHALVARPTGCTVVLCDGGAVAGVDVRGAAPGTRETDLLSPLNAVETVHAVMLAGGSAFGLDAAGGVMRWLDERGIGVAVGPARVPIVPAAILFDLWVGDARIRPDAASGYAACEAATDAPVAQGNVGAGIGASVGKLFGIEHAMKGGLGSASIRVDGVTVAALAAVNAVGDVIDPGQGGRVLAGARGADGRPRGTMAAFRAGDVPRPLQPGAATTLVIVATDAVLTKAEAGKMASMAHDGLARTIEPVHTQADGDTVFALATGRAARRASVTLLGALAADMAAAAIHNGVRAAQGLRLPGGLWLPAFGDLPPP